MEKRIKDFEDYAITDTGKVISYKYHQPRILKTWLDRHGYENIKLSKDGKTYHFLIHRLVAEAFINNDNMVDKTEINHINHIRNDNRKENLEWCDRTYNIADSNKGFVKNVHSCKLYNKEHQLIKEFSSIQEACKYANEKFDCSITYMAKTYKSKGYYIVKDESVETKLD